METEPHREAVLTWLNAWGRRQFIKGRHDHASGELKDRHEAFAATLPAEDVDL